MFWFVSDCVDETPTYIEIKPLSNLENIDIKPFAGFWDSSECTWWRETNRWCSRSWCTGWRRGWYQQTELSERSPTAGPSHTAGDTNTQTSLWVTVCSDLTEGKMSTCNISAACFNTLLRKEMCFLNTVLNMKESIRGVCLPHSWRRCPAHWWRGEPSYRGAERGSGPSCWWSLASAEASTDTQS